MATLLVHGGPVLTPFERIDGGAVLARDGRIEQVGPRSQISLTPADVEVDAGGRLICPGFIDLQVNGGGGAFLTEEPGIEALECMTRAHVRFGTTSMLPTIVTADEHHMLQALAAVRDAVARPRAGARVLGAHLEGPFINPARKGAHDARFIQPPRRDLLERFIDASGGSLRLITLAPELPSAPALIEVATAASIAVAAGHTEATFDEALHAIEAGVVMATHVFNAMRPLDRRDPGVIGAILQIDRVVAGLIADGVHVHPAVLDLVFRVKGAGGVALVSDALQSVGTDATSFRLQGRRVEVRDGVCYLEDGTLAGSALSMNRAVHLMERSTAAGLIDCVRMATATPARVLGLQDEIGVLRPGARADIVVCDAGLSVWKVFVAGALAYDAEKHQATR